MHVLHTLLCLLYIIISTCIVHTRHRRNIYHDVRISVTELAPAGKSKSCSGPAYLVSLKHLLSRPKELYPPAVPVEQVPYLSGLGPAGSRRSMPRGTRRMMHHSNMTRGPLSYLYHISLLSVSLGLTQVLIHSCGSKVEINSPMRIQCRKSPFST